MSDPAEVSTSELARALGVGFRTVQRWVSNGAITPAWTTPGGWHRWDLDDVRRQLREPRPKPAPKPAPEPEPAPEPVGGTVVPPSEPEPSGQADAGSVLVSAGPAAQHLGTDTVTLGRWVARGILTPTAMTSGGTERAGQQRWALDDLDRQVGAAREAGTLVLGADGRLRAARAHTGQLGARPGP